MYRLLIASIFIKALAAIAELLSQMVITNVYGVSSYGDYSFYVNLVEIAYWIFFSGMIKCNTYYLSDRSNDIRAFRKKYLLRYIVPVIGVLLLVSAVRRSAILVVCCAALAACFFTYDRSSRELARGRGYKFLFGEYLVGRVFLLAAFLVSGVIVKVPNILLLLVLYTAQFGIILLWFRFSCGKVEQAPHEIQVDLKKLWQFQQSDIAMGLIGQSPVILQYLFVGAYETGIVSIVVVIKKMVNFISGPTAKIFLPEFSRLYQQNKMDDILLAYRRIIQLQMLFISAMGVVLVGFPELVLRIFNPELVSYASLLRLVAAGFLVIASLGPETGLLQMTGQEKLENQMRWGTLVLMAVVWIIMRKDPFFALYGLCVQVISEGLIKYILICRWFKGIPISLLQYMILWVPMILLCSAVQIFRLNTSWIALFAVSFVCLLLTGGAMLFDRDIRTQVCAIMKRMAGTKR